MKVEYIIILFVYGVLYYLIVKSNKQIWNVMFVSIVNFTKYLLQSNENWQQTDLTGLISPIQVSILPFFDTWYAPISKQINKNLAIKILPSRKHY